MEALIFFFLPANKSLCKDWQVCVCAYICVCVLWGFMCLEAPVSQTGQDE